MSQDLPVTTYALLGLLTFGDELIGGEANPRPRDAHKTYPNPLFGQTLQARTGNLD